MLPPRAVYETRLRAFLKALKYSRRADFTNCKVAPRASGIASFGDLLTRPPLMFL